MKKNKQIIKLLKEVDYLNKKELSKPHGKTNEPRVQILIKAIQQGGHEGEDGSKVGIELTDGSIVYPVPPNKSKHNTELIQLLQSGNLDALYGKGDDALKFHAYAEDDDMQNSGYMSSYLYRVADIKKSGYFGGGRAAGKSDANLTSAQEAIQAMAIGYAIAKGGQITADEITPQILQKAANNFDVGSNDQQYMQEIFNSPKWKESIAKTANALMTKFNLSGMVIHHSSQWVKQMMNAFNKANKDLDTGKREFSHKDKWNPADIWAVKPGIDVPTGINDLAELKARMMQWYERGEVYGISLKAIGKTAQVKAFNISDKDIDDLLNLNIERLVVSNKDNQIFSNKSTVIHYESVSSFDAIKDYLREDTVETRTFQSSEENVTSELKGDKAKAAGGKINFNLINKILTDIKLPTLTSKEELRRKINDRGKTKSQKYANVVNEIIQNASVVNSAIEGPARKGLDDVINRKGWAFIVSKYQAVELMRILKETNKRKQRDFLQRLVRYASSRSELSSPFVKVW